MNDTQFWWREREAAWLLALVLVIHGTQMFLLPICGEESRRATVACEFFHHGDWIVPRQQGEPFLSRPPLQSWLIAGCALLRGDCDLIAVRLPSLVATLATTLLVYVYVRSFWSRTAALVAGAAFTTMAHVLELGSRAESEAVYTFLLGGAMLLWHMNLERRPVFAWTLGYGLAALATLTKSPQAAAYFGGAVLVYLAVRRDWRRLFGFHHALGILTFGVVMAAWLLPFINILGFDAVYEIGAMDVAMRYLDTRWQSFAGHMLWFPVEVFASTLPWSLLLLGLARRPVRSGWLASPPLLFLTICWAVAFPTCWFGPSGRARYLMPLYPCLAAILGGLVERMLALGAEIQPWPGARVRRCVLGLAAVIGCGYNAGIALFVAPHSEDIGPLVARLRDEELRGKPLVSFGPVQHLFAYYHREPIAIRSMPKRKTDVDCVEYFCFDRRRIEKIYLPFLWETIAEVPIDRRRRDDPFMVVVVGRRLYRAASDRLQPVVHRAALSAAP